MREDVSQLYARLIPRVRVTLDQRTGKVLILGADQKDRGLWDRIALPCTAIKLFLKQTETFSSRNGVVFILKIIHD